MELCPFFCFFASQIGKLFGICLGILGQDLQVPHFEIMKILGMTGFFSDETPPSKYSTLPSILSNQKFTSWTEFFFTRYTISYRSGIKACMYILYWFKNDNNKIHVFILHNIWHHIIVDLLMQYFFPSLLLFLFFLSFFQIISRIFLFANVNVQQIET